ncbi:hypothetical protein KIH74_23005 [Kineosporia sp. J2-2]|uniref:F0F1 ATP synthase subunit B n=1 Tax=Kineosporia corallincola TaxID=2835133 RepID=A0ABS5TL50_9ACTN|nr:hypothetical protein [Kineosporia corallincola]MBT0771829.1 hypothetical protein [Kineosporia corallincola]
MLAALAAAADAVKQAPEGFDLQSILQSYGVQFGFLAFVLACVAFRKFFVPEWTLRKEEERHAADNAARDERIAHLEDQVQRLQDLTGKELMPALARATDINARFVEEMTARRITEGRG